MNLTKIIISVFAVVFLAISAQAQSKKIQRAYVEINEQGYSRASIKLKRGIPARIVFLRKTDATCAKEVVIPAYGINRNLPLNEAIAVSFTPNKAGSFTFTCGMNMMRGKLIVQ